MTLIKLKPLLFVYKEEWKCIGLKMIKRWFEEGLNMTLRWQDDLMITLMYLEDKDDLKHIKMLDF